MHLKKIYEIIDNLAPFALSEEEVSRFGHYDNSGIILDCGGEITKIVFSLDLSAAAVEEAKKAGANCIVTHHPAIFSPVSSLTDNSGKHVLTCAKAGISVISAHLNLDCAPEGIDERLMQGLGGKEAISVCEELTGGGYGRVYEVEETSLTEFVEKAKKTFSTERIISYGEKPVKKVASFCGSGFSDFTLAFAFDRGADTIVSSDGKHHLILEAVERGMNVVLLTHYAAENYGFYRFFETMKEKTGLPCVFFTDKRFI